MKRVLRRLIRRPLDLATLGLMIIGLAVGLVLWSLVLGQLAHTEDHARTALHAAQAQCAMVADCSPTLVDTDHLADGGEVYVFRVAFTTTQGTTPDAPDGPPRLSVGALAVTLNPDGTVREVH